MQSFNTLFAIIIILSGTIPSAKATQIENFWDAVGKEAKVEITRDIHSEDFDLSYLGISIVTFYFFRNGAPTHYSAAEAAAYHSPRCSMVFSRPEDTHRFPRHSYGYIPKGVYSLKLNKFTVTKTDAGVSSGFLEFDSNPQIEIKNAKNGAQTGTFVSEISFGRLDSTKTDFETAVKYCFGDAIKFSIP